MNIQDNVTCRNCDRNGHFSKDCPEPKNWSKVQCRNCNEYGHSAGRCPNPAGVPDASNAGEDYTASAGPAAEVATEGDWMAGAGSAAADGGSDWQTAAPEVSAW